MHNFLPPSPLLLASSICKCRLTHPHTITPAACPPYTQMLTDIMSNRRKYRASLRAAAAAAAAHGVSKQPFPGSSAAAVGSSSDSNRSRPEALTSTSITGEKHSSVRPDEPTILLDVLLDAGEGPASNSTSVGGERNDEYFISITVSELELARIAIARYFQFIHPYIYRVQMTDRTGKQLQLRRRTRGGSLTRTFSQRQ